MGVSEVTGVLADVITVTDVSSEFMGRLFDSLLAAVIGHLAAKNQNARKCWNVAFHGGSCSTKVLSSVTA